MLTRVQYDLEHRLSIFIREEVLVWSQMSKNEPRNSLRELVLSNVDAVVRRAKVMSCKMEREKVRLLSALSTRTNDAPGAERIDSCEPVDPGAASPGDERAESLQDGSHLLRLAMSSEGVVQYALGWSSDSRYIVIASVELSLGRGEVLKAMHC